jgi:UDP-3-O-[3-hydroxymyristoyl] glucosamine N-acyltransferase
VGKYCYIGQGCLIKAQWIGDCVKIGKGSILENNVIVEDNVIIENNTYVPEGSRLCKNSVFGGVPA